MHTLLTTSIAVHHVIVLIAIKKSFVHNEIIHLWNGFDETWNAKEMQKKLCEMKKGNYYIKKKIKKFQNENCKRNSRKMLPYITIKHIIIITWYYQLNNKY